jgi:hypothetical protein
MTGNYYMCDCRTKTNKGRQCKCSNTNSAGSSPNAPTVTSENTNNQEAIKEANQGPNELSEEQKAAPVSINQSMNKTFKANNASARLNASLSSKNSTSTMNPLKNASLLSKTNTKLNNKRLNTLKQYKGVNPLRRTKKGNKPNASRVAERATTQRVKNFLEDNSEKPRAPNQNVVEAQAMLSKLRNSSNDAALAAKEAALNLKRAKGKEDLAKARKEKEVADEAARLAKKDAERAEALALRAKQANQGAALEARSEAAIAEKRRAQLAEENALKAASRLQRANQRVTSTSTSPVTPPAPAKRWNTVKGPKLVGFGGRKTMRRSNKRRTLP